MSDELVATAWASDQMQRGPVALFLSNYLDSHSKIKVLNINAPWGAGKTFFLNNWMLQEKTHRACVYFNAWENDFTGDSFVSLVSAIRDQLQDIIGLPVKADGIVQEFTQKAAKAMVAATPALAKGVLKKLTGTDLDVLKELIDEDALGDAAEKAVETMITSSRDALNAVNDFKKVFHELLVAAADKAQSGETKCPVYIFIDELDRCRPTFSIELLERLKHLFDAPNCKFIIATDSQQLGEAIKAVYGNGFDSRRYLKRFFDSEFTLDNADYAAWIKANFALLPDPAPMEMGHSIEDPLASRTYSYGSGRERVAADKDTVLTGPHRLDADQVIFLALA
ncbi:KAP family P-loop NTPase fold protein [Pseudomonas bohemica]|uniref:KAP family P-loop NTPase fold protein n=1 Tax=Pseudomonas bohemica TaxID=2044872 RepID=UPI000DA61933|nr:P-loop NTPase fold protein [Pseudomonas bohemica]